MKLIYLISIFSLSNNLFSQEVISIADSEKKYSKDSLQEHYFYRIMSDEITECFEVSPELFLSEWSKFTREVGKYLKDNNFLFGKQTKGLVDVYFNKNGTIDYFFISLRDDTVSKEKFDKMLSLLKEFSKGYKFTISAKQAFSNSGGINFMH
ncbi:MAG: hypothetical protein V4622_00400 [Bacteroidota bacterium]